MIFINPNKIAPPQEWVAEAENLSRELAEKPPEERGGFIDSKREATWGHPALLQALRDVAGNKCWYSEVPLEGADPNVDHFRPKGRVREVDGDLQPTRQTWPGYWWWAFEFRNFRLSSAHANQRRVDEETQGGKSDFFPVIGARAADNLAYDLVEEEVLALDPCSASDVSLLWFDPLGAPSCSNWRRTSSGVDQRRVKATIWLYHLDKQELKRRRANHITDVQTDLRNANTEYKLWKESGGGVRAKSAFDRRVNDIKKKLEDSAEFASAKRCAVRAAIADYEWIESEQIL